MITKDLGMVTAYAYAVSKGYTGTETEFAELMASYATVAQEAVDAALAAAQSAQSAQDAQTAAEGASDTAQATVSGAIAGIQAEGQTQIGAVQSEGTAQVGNVNSAGQTQVGNVNAAGATQVGNVNTAGSTQVSAIQAKGNQIIDSLPEDYTEIRGQVSQLSDEIADFQEDNYTTVLRQIDETAVGWRLNESNGLCSSDSNYQLVKYQVTAGDKIKVIASDRFQFQTVASVPSSGSSNRVGITYSAGTYFLTVPETATYLVFSSEKADGTAEAYNVIPYVDVLQEEVNQTEQEIANIGKLNFNILDGVSWGFGNINGETGSTSSSTTRLACDYIDVTQYDSIEFSADSGYKYHAFLINSEKTSVIASIEWSTGVYSIDITAHPTGKYARIMMQRTDNTVTTADYVHVHASGKNALYELASGVNISIPTTLDNARHIKNNTGTPLTILHISDIHRDPGVFARINSQIAKLENQIDVKICTGDMVNDVAGLIGSWWDSDFMTCIGNHDTASYTSGVGYNWTALSMADRDTYYISPFEANWGITHTAGTSYYYKDYADAKVRLIVMDAMLYSDEGATNATAQTAWLADLLASAITGELHVLIAIHAPHGGAVAEDCSFSRYGQTAMPTNNDCNTPQTVIDTVATAISNGLHFIGYLVGHTHQDNIWDAENNGKQMMYCITCANVSKESSWITSDQHRSQIEDAYNLVTIDTANTLIKIIRGGGANIDDHMRTRKAICFNYSTGEKVGEIL